MPPYQKQAIGVRAALERSELDYGPLSVHEKMRDWPSPRPPFPGRPAPGKPAGSGRTQGHARSAQPRTSSRHKRPLHYLNNQVGGSTLRDGRSALDSSEYLASQPGARHAVNGYRSWRWLVKVTADRTVVALSASPGSD
jgi:hypothetical protein